MGKMMTIGIAGGTGSGKTTITRKILREFGQDVSVIYHDNYYKAHDDMPYEERAKLNYDHPDAFDTALMVRQLNALRRGKAVQCPVYDYNRPQPLQENRHRPPGPCAGDRGHPHLPEQGPPGPDGH